MKSFQKIGIVGSGNVAVQLTSALVANGIKPIVCYGRNPTSGTEFSKLFDVPFSQDLSALEGLDVIIACVSDDALATLIPQLASICSVLSTSGTVDVCAFEHQFPIGVMYPLQTMTKKAALPFRSIPLFIEASDSTFLAEISIFANKLVDTVVKMDAKQRKKLHIAAVFINNFTNHLLDLMQDFSSENQLDFQWFAPLLNETVAKALKNPAKNNQTGPARRNDQATIQAHEAQLEEPLLSIYRTMTTSIQQRFQTND
jgi:hypothetical protein